MLNQAFIGGKNGSHGRGFPRKFNGNQRLDYKIQGFNLNFNKPQNVTNRIISIMHKICRSIMTMDKRLTITSLKIRYFHFPNLWES